jgi:hypothetical protein
MTTRVDIDFSEKASEELDALQQRLGVNSQADVITLALGTYHWLADEVLNKKHLILVDKPEEGTVQRVEFTFLKSVQPRSRNEQSPEQSPSSPDAPKQHHAHGHKLARTLTPDK